MSSDNPSGADNQQETEQFHPLDAQWVVGFVDGEDCFSVSVHRNRGARSDGNSTLCSRCLNTGIIESCSGN